MAQKRCSSSLVVARQLVRPNHLRNFTLASFQISAFLHRRGSGAAMTHVVAGRVASVVRRNPNTADRTMLHDWTARLFDAFLR